MRCFVTSLRTTMERIDEDEKKDDDDNEEDEEEGDGYSE